MDMTHHPHASVAKANYITMANSNGQESAEPCVHRRGTINMGITVTPIIKYLAHASSKVPM